MSVADAAAFNPNSIKMDLGNGFKYISIKGNPVFNNGSESLPKNPPNCTILCKWVFDNFILGEELFAKTLQSLKTWVLVNNNLCDKLYLLLESPTNLMKDLKLLQFHF